MKRIPKVTHDPKSALAAHQSTAAAAAKDRFAVATEITREQPTGLSPEVPAPAPGAGTPLPTANRTVVATAADLLLCTPGTIVRAPLSLIDLNPLSPRHFYTEEMVDRIAATLPDGQDDAAHGYVEDGRIKLIDGGTRFRAAKDSDTPFLDIKLEEPPESKLALYQRARALNDQRSAPSTLDFALSLSMLMELGELTSQQDAAEKVLDQKGNAISQATVSKYIRIAKLPPVVQRAMSVSEETSSFNALYEVSQLFPDGLDVEALAERTDVAVEVVDEIKRKKLSKQQIAALVKSKIDGPKTRERSSVHQLDLAGHKGHIKLFARKGKLDLSLQGLSEDRLPKLRDALEATLKQFLAGQ